MNEHAPVKTRRVKTKRLPDWFTPEISLNQKLRDNCNRLQQRDDYKNTVIKLEILYELQILLRIYLKVNRH